MMTLHIYFKYGKEDHLAAAQGWVFLDGGDRGLQEIEDCADPHAGAPRAFQYLLLCSFSPHLHKRQVLSTFILPAFDTEMAPWECL